MNMLFLTSFKGLLIVLTFFDFCKVCFFFQQERICLKRNVNALNPWKGKVADLVVFVQYNNLRYVDSKNERGKNSS